MERTNTPSKDNKTTSNKKKKPVNKLTKSTTKTQRKKITSNKKKKPVNKSTKSTTKPQHKQTIACRPLMKRGGACEDYLMYNMEADALTYFSEEQKGILLVYPGGKNRCTNWDELDQEMIPGYACLEFTRRNHTTIEADKNTLYYKLGAPFPMLISEYDKTRIKNLKDGLETNELLQIRLKLKGKSCFIVQETWEDITSHRQGSGVGARLDKDNTFPVYECFEFCKLEKSLFASS